jgi:acyl-coenzyme A synthetase/AMP-(fatty) acid ligase
VSPTSGSAKPLLRLSWSNRTWRYKQKRYVHTSRSIWRRFKVPEHVWVRSEQLPRIASGKIYKRGLREEAIAVLNRKASA